MEHDNIQDINFGAFNMTTYMTIYATLYNNMTIYSTLPYTPIHL